MDQKDKAQFEMLKKGIHKGVYDHYKRGDEYIVYSLALDEKTLAPTVCYFSVKEQTRWTRPYEEFFGIVRPDDSSPGGGLLAPVQRFTFVRSATRDELILAAGIG